MASPQRNVAWQCTFADAATRDADLAARAASVEFESVRVQMRKLFAIEMRTAEALRR
jgi:hypothetical protein